MKEKKRYKKEKMKSEMFSESEMNKGAFAEARREGKKLWIEEDNQGNIIASVWYEVIDGKIIYAHRAWCPDDRKLGKGWLKIFETIKDKKGADLFIGHAIGKIHDHWIEVGMNELGEFVYV